MLSQMPDALESHKTIGKMFRRDATTALCLVMHRILDTVKAARGFCIGPSLISLGMPSSQRNIKERKRYAIIYLMSLPVRARATRRCDSEASREKHQKNFFFFFSMLSHLVPREKHPSKKKSFFFFAMLLSCIPKMLLKHSGCRSCCILSRPDKDA